ncbi:hypothetical protein CBOM_07447 [Ceraceosorus bombacis]|uniref:Uncharacterized protein n=1 Tax=Ceraceosorus bombacis TaxID=401625 RepID=A0A0P1BCS8_9BASI|nr:hypothetical protein CBOM_07447 [Ceraceosorus bombacis]
MNHECRKAAARVHSLWLERTKEEANFYAKGVRKAQRWRSLDLPATYSLAAYVSDETGTLITTLQSTAHVIASAIELSSAFNGQRVSLHQHS